MLQKYLAFLKKDFLFESSYKVSFLMNIFAVTVSLLGYFFIDKMFGYRMVKHLEGFGVNYFSYVLLGMAFFSYIGFGLGSFSDRLRFEQIQGTLESILLTPTRIPVILASLALWNFILATFDMTIYVLLGIFLFKINFGNINVLSAVVILILAVVSLSSLGIISASFIMIFKRGNPLGWFINNLEGLLGGVYFPITVMPAWLQLVAKLSPITYAIRAIELAVYKGYSLTQLAAEITILSFFCIALFPSSIAIFKYALKKAMLNGSLTQY